MSEKFEKIGVIGIDAGCCWIGDPCYLAPTDRPTAPLAPSPASGWSKFIDWLHGADGHGFDDGAKEHPDGCIVSTGWGDGCYPVEVRRSPEGRIAEVRVRFIED